MISAFLWIFLFLELIYSRRSKNIKYDDRVVVLLILMLIGFGVGQLAFLIWQNVMWAICCYLYLLGSTFYISIKETMLRNQISQRRYVLNSTNVRLRRHW